jgi:hypothetical protein
MKNKTGWLMLAMKVQAAQHGDVRVHTAKGNHAIARFLPKGKLLVIAGAESRVFNRGKSFSPLPIVWHIDRQAAAAS